jgi:hypothetical protein
MLLGFRRRAAAGALNLKLEDLRPNVNSRSRDRRGHRRRSFGMPSVPVTIAVPCPSTCRPHREYPFLAHTSREIHLNLGVAHACLVCGREAVHCQIHRTDPLWWQTYHGELKLVGRRLGWTQVLQAQLCLPVYQEL